MILKKDRYIFGNFLITKYIAVFGKRLFAVYLWAQKIVLQETRVFPASVSFLATHYFFTFFITFL